MGAYLDGDDLCAGCGRCCHDITALRVTDEELDRVDRLRPYVVRREGQFNLLDVPGACPYLLPDGRCGTFATRPFDCSLYPVNVSSIGVRQPDGTVTARWMFTAQDCPERPAMVALSRRKGVQPVADWLADLSGASSVTMVHDGSPWRESTAIVLDRLHLLRLARRLLGRAPMPRKPAR